MNTWLTDCYFLLYFVISLCFVSIIVKIKNYLETETPGAGKRKVMRGQIIAQVDIILKQSLNNLHLVFKLSGSNSEVILENSVLYAPIL